MRTYLTLLTLALVAAFALAQDPGMQAAQAAQMAQQAAQQANDQMMQAAQQANQQAMQNAQQAAQTTSCYRCGAAAPKFSVKPGAYSAGRHVKNKRLDPRSGNLLHDGRLDADCGVNPIHGSDYD